MCLRRNDTIHAEAETRRQYLIRKDGRQEHAVFLVSFDMDCTALTLLKPELKNYNIVHMVSD